MTLNWAKTLVCVHHYPSRGSISTHYITFFLFKTEKKYVAELMLHPISFQKPKFNIILRIKDYSYLYYISKNESLLYWVCKKENIERGGRCTSIPSTKV